MTVQESHITVITRTIMSLGGNCFIRAACDLAGLDNEIVAIGDAGEEILDALGTNDVQHLTPFVPRVTDVRHPDRFNSATSCVAGPHRP